MNIGEKTAADTTLSVMEVSNLKAKKDSGMREVISSID